MSEEVKKYEFAGKTYVQKMMVWGQVKELALVLKGLAIRDGMTVLDIMSILEDKLPDALAVVLTEEGTSVKDKDKAVILEDLELIPIATIMQVIEDFFVCNPIALITDKLIGMIGGMQEKMEQVKGNGM